MFHIKLDTLDGIRNSNKKDKYFRPQLLCPKGHLLKRHRRRDARQQYYCSNCDTYYTEKPRYQTFKKDSGYYDQFIEHYIKECLLGNKPNVSDLCKKHNLSRASTYRHLFDNDKKLILECMVNLHTWKKQALGGLYKIKVHGQMLEFQHQSGQLPVGSASSRPSDPALPPA